MWGELSEGDHPQLIAKPTTKSGLIDDSMIVAIPYRCSSSLSLSVQQLVSPVL